MPRPVAEMLAFACRKTPLEFAPVPHEVPLIVTEPELVVTLDPDTSMPLAELVPFAAVPVIVTWPSPVAEMLAFACRKTPLEFVPVPHEVPLIVSVPELVVTVALDAETPVALFVDPFPLTPVIVTQPDPPA